MSAQNQSKYSMNNYNIQEPRQQQYTDYNTDSIHQPKYSMNNYNIQEPR